MQDEQPLRLLGHIGVAMARAVHQGIQDHEAHMHDNTPTSAPIKAVPFPNDHIPDATLARMVEMLERLDAQDLGTAFVARTFNYPESLVARELADYKARYRRYIQHRANA